MDCTRLYLMSFPVVATNPRSTFRMLAPDPICKADIEEIASDMVAAYRRMYPGIRNHWLRIARPKMSKRAWRRLRGKVKGLKRVR